MINHEKYMREAIELAKKAKGFTSPNPCVGAVIVKNDQIISKAYHKGFRLPHAEVAAIKNTELDIEGSTLYINLEPCHHQGFNPPCTKSIIDSGIKKVFIGMQDPNPLVNGKGIRALLKNKIDVQIGLLNDACRDLNEDYIKYIKTERPLVNLKIAATLDGKIADKDGNSKWITNLDARREVHRLRREVDAIITGSQTIIQDDPKFNVRLISARRKRLKIVVLDTNLKISTNAQIFSVHDPRNIIIFVGKKHNKEKSYILEKRGVSVIQTRSEHEIKIPRVLDKLGELDVMSVLVEGGRKISSSFLKEELVDKVYYFVSTKFLGGENSIDALENIGAGRLSCALNLKKVKFTPIDDNFLIEGYI